MFDALACCEPSVISFPQQKSRLNKPPFEKIISHLSKCINGLIQFPSEETAESVRRPEEAVKCDRERRRALIGPLAVSVRPLADGRPLVVWSLSLRLTVLV